MWSDPPYICQIWSLELAIGTRSCKRKVVPSLGLGFGSLVTPNPFWDSVLVGTKQGHHIEPRFRP